MASIKRDYKSSMFCMLWENKEELLSLYNATSGMNYTNADDLIINTLRNAIYMGMKNDISFIVEMSLNLYEHQSTVNPNMPLRDLLYVAKVLQGMVKDENLYSSALVKIPTPKFVVFYNGTAKQPERQMLRLSDSFSKQAGEVNLELVVEVLNINPGNNEKLLNNCKTLREYVMYVERVRTYLADMPVEQAVNRAVDECIKEGILADFLSQNKAEAIEVSIFEYNQEAHMNSVRQEGYEDGRADGRKEGLAVGREEGLAVGRKEGIVVGREEGLATGRMEGTIQAIEFFVLEYLEDGIPAERIVEKLMRGFSMTKEQAEETVERYKK